MELSILEKLVLKYIDRNWNYYWLSQNVNISAEFIEQNIHLPWIWENVSSNVNISFEFYKRHKYKNWRFEALSANPAITLEDIENNIYLPWNWVYISENPNLTIHFLRKHRYKKFAWYKVSKNKNISLSDIANNPNLPWDWNSMTYHPDMNFEFIKYYENKPWDWRYLSLSNIVTIKDIEDNIEFPWEYNYIKYRDWNPTVQYTIEYIKNNIDRLHLISWLDACKDKGITVNDIENNPDVDWNWTYVSANPNITYDFIVKNEDKISFWMLSKNMFHTNNDNINYYKRRKHKTNELCNLIKQELLDTAWHPDRVFMWCIDNDFCWLGEKKSV